MIGAIQFFSRQTKAKVTLLGFGLALALGMLDYVAGPEVALSTLYLFPIALVTWFACGSAGVVISLASVAAWAGAEVLAHPIDLRSAGPYVFAAVRLGAFLFATYFLSRLRALNRSLRVSVEERTAALLTEVSERKKSEAGLRQSEAFYHSLVEHLPQNIFRKDCEGRYTFANPRFCRHAGRPLEQIIGFTTAEVFPPAQADVFHRDDLQVMTTGQILDAIVAEQMPDGRTVYLQAIKTPLFDTEGRLVGVQGIFWDITERRQAEINLQASQSQYQNLVDTLDGIVFEINAADFEFTFVSPQCERILGYTPARWLREVNWRRLIHPGDIEMVFATCGQAVERMQNHTLEYRVLAADGRVVWVRDLATVIVENDRPVKVRGVLLDITERKRADELLQASLKEKEVLLKEIHHRVKNNLQIISSLLRLQSERIADPNIVALFQQSQNRVRSMALIHEKLYKSKDFARIDFADYIRGLTEIVSRSYGMVPARVHIELRLEQIFLGIDTAIPVGLILSELISNAFKHAFPEGREGIITIEFHQHTPESVRLTVRDDGVGGLQGLDSDGAKSFGFSLVQLLTQQIGGILQFRAEKGTELTVDFPVVRSF